MKYLSLFILFFCFSAGATERTDKELYDRAVVVFKSEKYADDQLYKPKNEFYKYSDAYEVLQALSDKGYKSATRYLRNYKRDIDGKLAAEKGDAESQFKLAYRLESRYPTTAKYWYKKADKQGNFKAYCKLNEVRAYNTYTAKSAEQLATNAFECKLNHVTPWIDTAKDDASKKELREFFKLYVKAQGGRKPDSNSQFVIGLYYRYGNGAVKQDIKKAHQWLLKAYSNGSEQAATELQFLYDEGLAKAPRYYVPNLDNRELYAKGVEYFKAKDYYRAFNHFEKAAKDNHMNSQYMLGIMYLQQQGVSQNLKLSKKWLEKAAAQGSKPAQDVLDAEFKS